MAGQDPAAVIIEANQAEVGFQNVYRTKIEPLNTAGNATRSRNLYRTSKDPEDPILIKFDLTAAPGHYARFVIEQVIVSD